MKVLITGIASRVGRMVASELLRREIKVLGIDIRPWPDAPPGVEMFRADIRKRPAEDVFRTRSPDAVIHMATVTHLSRSSAERHRINLDGTQKVFEHCRNYGVEQAIFVGRHTFYGADSESHLYHTESEPPMAVSTYPELADLVAADLFAGSALWRFPEIKTVVLRMVYLLGPSRVGTLANFLRGPRVPTVVGFDPLFQFIHEHDAARAIVRALVSELRGVYNVAGPRPVPLSLLVKVTGRKNLRMPESVFRRAIGHFGLPSLPPGAVNHIKYPVVVDGGAFDEATGFESNFDEVKTMEAFAAVDDRWQR